MNMLVPTRLILLLTFLLLFMGCTPSRPIGDVVTVEVTRATETPTPIPATPTTLATQPVVATPTKTPTPTPTATASPTPRASATPTVSPTPTAAFPDPATLEVMSTDTVTSPDGRWQAISTQYQALMINQSPEHYVSLTVTDGTTTWTPVAEWRGFGIGHLWPAAFQWSQDGRYLYYTNLGGIDGCYYFTNGTDLHRLDLSDGTAVAIIPEGKSLNLSLSADDATLAYIGYDGRVVSFVVHDLATGAEQRVAISEPGTYAQAGQIYRSADGETAVLTLIYDICQPTESSSIVRINLAEMTATTLVPQDDRRLQILDWPDPAQPEIQVIDKDGNSWLLNINSGELALLDATIYTNREHGYRLQYPKELHSLDNFGVESERYFSTHPHAGNPLEIGAAGFWVTVSRAANPDGLTLDQWADLHQKPGEEQTLTVAGETAVQVIVDLAAAGEPHPGIAISTIIAHGGQIYTIEGIAQTAEAFADYLPVYQQLLHSFQFLDENP